MTEYVFARYPDDIVATVVTYFDSDPALATNDNAHVPTTGAVRSYISTFVAANYQPLDADLTALAAQAGTGIAVRTAADTWTTRQITQPAAGITVTNPAGIAGNMTLVLANDLAGVEGLATNGMVARTATDTWTTRTIASTSTGLVVTNGDGVAGAPSFALDSDLQTISTLTATSNNFMAAVSSAWASVTPATAAGLLAVEIGKLLHPVGSLYFTTNSTNPGTSLGFGTWSAFGAGQVPVGFLAADPDFGTDEATGGEKTHLLTAAEIPAHNHTVGGSLNSAVGAATRGLVSGGGGTDPVPSANNSGGGGSHNNLQPFIVVRIWKRTA
jgi:hypothetical protein